MRAALLVTLALLGALDVALIAWIATTGGGELELAGRRLSATSAENPLTLLAALALGFELAREHGGGPLRALLSRARAAFTGARPATRAALVLLGLALVTNLAQLTRLVDVFAESRALHRQRLEAGAPAGVRANPANGHAPYLVDHLVRREGPRATPVWIDDRDARGHTAAFWAYPRLFLMEPGERAASLAHRMAAHGEDDPAFELAPRPPRERSRAFAADRGAPLVVASPTGAAEEP